MRTLNPRVDAEGHRYHKKKPLDCGKTQCGLCRDVWTKGLNKYPEDYNSRVFMEDESTEDWYHDLRVTDFYERESGIPIFDPEFHSLYVGVEDLSREEQEAWWDNYLTPFGKKMEEWLGNNDFSAFSHVPRVVWMNRRQYGRFLGERIKRR